jgi:hypothetical protein
MVARRHRAMPPFEVMGSATSSAGTSPPAVAPKAAKATTPTAARPVPEKDAGAKPATTANGSGRDRTVAAGASTTGAGVKQDVPQRWRWAGLLGGRRRHAAAPIVVRIPPGHAILLVLLLVGLIVLAFWVGRYLGDSGGFQRGYTQHKAEVDTRQVPGADLGAGAVLAGTRREENASRQGSKSSPMGLDARIDERNYWILAKVLVEEGIRMRQFLGEHGVDSFVRPLDNKGLCYVIALRDFSGPNDQARQFEREVKRLGMMWKSEHKGTDSFRTMYLEKHRAPRQP